MAADHAKLAAHVEAKWPAIQAALEDYIRIPNQRRVQADARVVRFAPFASNGTLPWARVKVSTIRLVSLYGYMCNT